MCLPLCLRLTHLIFHFKSFKVLEDLEYYYANSHLSSSLVDESIQQLRGLEPLM
jgi:hypothetical protein